MCGIAGVIVGSQGADGTAEQFRPHVERMIRTLAHRGPDAHGMMEFPGALLGHTRLSIVDLSGGEQPMRCAIDPNVAVTFNGEIYGYQQLKKELGGYPFRTVSDTELLPALYRRHGDAFTERLPGMFAFGLWDQERRTLLAARDRFGEKPFYYAEFQQPDGQPGLVFASEIKAILASGLVVPRVNRAAMAHYLQYLYVHPTQTIYENVQTLPPGHRLKYADGKLDTERYWQLPPARDDVSAEDAVERFRGLFEQAVRRQLVADVPVGAFLSGGLDSSTVVATAARMQPGLQTFAFRFADGGVDEIPYADAVAKMHRTQHHVLDDVHADVADLLQEMATVYDEPFADSSNIPTFLIAKLARQHMKVVLTGDGGDELLAGYPWYRDLLQLQPGAPVAEARWKQTRYFSDATLAKLGLAPQTTIKEAAGGHGPVDRALRMDLLDYMPGDILTKIDRASMAHGLELRAPFLDAELASFLISLLESLKIDERGDKLLLRRAFAELWPQSVRKRSKQGFGAPVERWLARPAVHALAVSRLEDPRHPIYTLLPFDATRIAVERRSTQAWILLVLALWLEVHPR